MKKLLLIISLVIVTMLSFSCSRSFHRWNAKRTGDIGEAYIINDPKERLRILAQFEDNIAEIKTNINKYENLTNDEAKPITETVINRGINEYNSNMRKYNYEMWANEDLPRRLNEWNPGMKFRDLY